MSIKRQFRKLKEELNRMQIDVKHAEMCGDRVVHSSVELTAVFEMVEKLEKAVEEKTGDDIAPFM